MSSLLSKHFGWVLVLSVDGEQFLGTWGNYVFHVCRNHVVTGLSSVMKDCLCAGECASV